MYGGSCIFGGGLDRTSQSPKCVRISLMTEGSSMKLIYVELNINQLM